MSLILLLDILNLGLSILLIAIGILIQFIPNLEVSFSKMTKIAPLLKPLKSRPIQLVVGFALVGAGLRMF